MDIEQQIRRGNFKGNRISLAPYFQSFPYRFCITKLHLFGESTKFLMLKCVSAIVFVTKITFQINSF